MKTHRTPSSVINALRHLLLCAACGHANTADAKFCSQCATPLLGLQSSFASVQSRQHEAASERRLHALLPAVTGWLQRDGRLTYRTLKYLLGLNDALLEAIREELRLRRLAIAEEGKVLVWIGETALHAPPTLEALVPLPNAQRHRPAAPAEDAPVEALSDAPMPAPEPMRSAPEAERRQLTVIFCDLADSTTLSQQLDPEDLRDVIRAYQATATAVIQQYQGHMAQYLGDGLLMYFGWPVAHEDDAQRAAHAGLGIIEAVTADLNPRLAHQYGVQLTVRLGVHTGPVVVGEMGGGGRQESLATGETVNIARFYRI